MHEIVNGLANEERSPKRRLEQIVAVETDSAGRRETIAHRGVVESRWRAACREYRNRAGERADGVAYCLMRIASEVAIFENDMRRRHRIVAAEPIAPVV